MYITEDDDELWSTFPTGTALYVYCIIPTYPAPGTGTATDLTFTLDGNQEASYVFNPSGTTVGFEYDQIVFTVENLANSQHSFSFGPADGSGSIILFDYAVYT